MLYPFDATINEIIDKKITKILDNIKRLFWVKVELIFFPSTTIMLEIAFNNVSIVLIVNETAKIIIIIDKNSFLSFKRIEKKARSGFTLVSIETATIPVTPIKKTIGIIIRNEIIRLLFNTLLFLAAKTLCQFPWWKRLVAATAMKKVKPAV